MIKFEKLSFLVSSSIKIRLHSTMANMCSRSFHQCVYFNRIPFYSVQKYTLVSVFHYSKNSTNKVFTVNTGLVSR